MKDIQMVKPVNELKGNVRNLFLKAPALIAVVRGPHHVYELANELYLKIVGNRDIVGKPIREALPELEGQGLFEILDNVYSTGEAFIGNELPVKIDKGNGKLEEVFFNFVYQPLENSEGEMEGIMVHGVDVTEQVLARKKIEESETRLQLITDALPVLISYIDKNRTYRFNNKAYETWFGHSSIEIFGKNLQNVLGEAAYNNLKPKIDKVLSGKPVHFEMVVPYKDGGTRWVVADYIPHIGKDNAVLGFYAMVNDVSAIKSAEALNYQLASIVQSSTDAIISKTLGGIVTSWNAGAERIFGYTAEEMIGQPITKLIPGDRLEEEPRILQNISQAKVVDHFVTQRRTKDGKLIDISLTISPIKDSEGNIIGASKIARDITDDIKVQRKIEESEQQLRKTTQHFAIATSAAQVGIWSLDIATQTLEWSDLHKKMWGYTNLEKNLTYEDWHKLIVDEDKETTLNALAGALKKKSLYRVSYRIKRQDNGAICWINSTGQYFYNDAGDPITLTGVSIDITEQKLAEQALKESEVRLRLATQTSAVGIWEWNVVTNKIRWDVQMFHIYGITPSADGFVEYATWKNAIVPEDLAEQERILQDTVKKAGSSKRAFRIFRANDGMLRDIEAIETVRTNAQGGTEWVVGTNMDVTERNLAVEKIKDSERKLEIKVAERTKELEQKNTELQNTNKELEAFTYISSHDLQEPLRKIRTFAGRIIARDNDNLSDTSKDYFRRMQYAATRMQTLIQDLLTFSRISTSERKFQITDHNKIVEEVIEEFKETIEEKKAMIIITELCTSNINPFQFRQLMHNLIGNALKFSKPDMPPRIIIKSTIAKGIELNTDNLLPENKYCHISVADTGIGFEQMYAERIFQVFQRLHGNKEYAGTGIGLAIVKKIVDNHNGIIIAESELGKGATFHIYLPV